METHAPLPLLNGEVAQHLVRYTGDRTGRSAIRGRSSHTQYHHSALDPLFPVLDQDLPDFRLRDDFEVTGHRILGPAERLAQEQADRLADVLQQLEALKAPVATVPKRSTGGRPRHSDATLSRGLHLKHHAEHKSSNNEIAREIYRDTYEEYENPENAIAKLLQTARQRFPDHVTDCQWCR